VLYRGLDTFRLLAFMAVFLYHVDMMEVGYLGVLAFFVLSGFLITPILVGMKRELVGHRFFLNFYGRRCLRIFPLYYLYLAVLGAGALLALSVEGLPKAIQQVDTQIVYALTYSYDFFHASRIFVQSPLLTHFWSLAVEEQFYLVWPVVVFVVSARRLKGVLVAMIVAGPVFRIVEASLFTTQFSRVLYPRSDMTIYVLPFSHIDAFAIGGYFALYGKTPGRMAVAIYAALLLVVGMMTERLATGSTGLAFGYGPFMSDSWKVIWAYTLWNVLFGWVLLMTRDRALFRPIMEHPALNYLGKISYGLYVYHFAVIWLVSVVVRARFSQLPLLPRLLLIGVALGVTIVISGVSYAVIERPFLRLKDRYFSRTPSQKAAPIQEPAVAMTGPFQAT